MKLHPTVIEKLLKIYETYGGFREETKLRNELKSFDLTPYTRQTGDQSTFLVLTEEVLKYTDGHQ